MQDTSKMHTAGSGLTDWFRRSRASGAHPATGPLPCGTWRCLPPLPCLPCHFTLCGFSPVDVAKQR